MQRLFIFCLLLVLAGSASLQCKASHLFGADLQYTHVTGNQYKIRLTLYGDCSALDTSVFNQLYSATPYILIKKNGFAYPRIMLSLQANSGKEVSPVCPGELMNTFCNGGTLPGIRQFIFEDTTTLDGISNNWQFIFNGELGSGFRAGRSTHIGNITGTTVMQLTATLNNTNGPNSSPVYGTIPTPFYCINVLQQYNQGATDPNADSLEFSLVQGIDAYTATPAPVNYKFPYTATLPLSTGAGGFYFNHLNGQMTFNPDITQNALVVAKVSEYKGGQLVGTSQRELTFIVRDNCEGIPPTAVFNSITGATVTNGSTINICKGEPFVNFEIGIDNPGGDSTILTYGGLPAGASFIISNNNSASPYANFSWATDTLKTGNYTFFLTIKNNHCPIFNTTTIAYTIRVVNYPTIQQKLIAPTDCIHKATVAYHLSYGFLPRKVTIVQGGVVIKTLIDSTGTDSLGVVIDSLNAGDYTAIVSSDAVCSASISFSIKDSGTLKLDDINYSLCKGDPMKPIFVQAVAPGATINWFDERGFALPDAPTVNTNAIGDYTWYFIESYKTCTSGPVNVSATVHSLPMGEILNVPKSICFGDKIYLRATGGTKYIWMPDDNIKTDTGGKFIEVLVPTTITVSVIDDYNCADTVSVIYSDIQQCCNFNYPNAFTPNDDGRNDGYRVVTYGNMLFYNLTIFNRWGQLIFHTNDPKTPWDGTYAGVPCEIGTYYYYLDAQCLTGPKEFHKGDIILIR